MVLCVKETDNRPSLQNRNINYFFVVVYGVEPSQLDILDFLFCIFYAALENMNGTAINTLNPFFYNAVPLRFLLRRLTD